MNNTCPECGGPVSVQKYVHVSNVGGAKVTDGRCLRPTCEVCSNVDLSVADLAMYERKAAAIVLQHAPKATGEMVRYARKALGLTQTDLGNLLDCAMETVSRWETDSKPVPRDSQLALLAILDYADRHKGDIKMLGKGLSGPMPAELNVEDDCQHSTSTAA